MVFIGLWAVPYSETEKHFPGQVLPPAFNRSHTCCNNNEPERPNAQNLNPQTVCGWVFLTTETPKINSEVEINLVFDEVNWTLSAESLHSKELFSK